MLSMQETDMMLQDYADIINESSQHMIHSDIRPMNVEQLFKLQPFNRANNIIEMIERSTCQQDIEMVRKLKLLNDD
jgi:hypothetical protein